MYLKHGKKGYFLLPENQKKKHYLRLENSVKTLFFRSFFVCRKESGKDDGRTGKADQRDADEGDGL